MGNSGESLKISHCKLSKVKIVRLCKWLGNLNLCTNTS